MTTAVQSLLSLRAHIATTLFTSQVYYHLIETLFFMLIIYLALTRAYKPWSRQSSPRLSAQEEARIIAQWQPEPLASPPSNAVQEAQPLDINITSQGSASTVLLEGKEAINVATNNFLGLVKHPKIEEAVLNTMRDYGCGACGPRGFYGTTDVHLECEDALANFSQTSSAILYSFGVATGSSTIPAFIKREDLVVIPNTLHPSLRLGVDLSRAMVLTFEHNNMKDLRNVLTRATSNDAKEPKKAYTQRRLIIMEAISDVVGDVCPLDEVVKLKDEFCFRLLLDESLSIGVLGESGYGALQQFHLPRKSVEIATADLGNAIASVGGYCVGADDVVDHQRLSGAGYCFSASQPPFLAKAATTALSILQEEGKHLIQNLRNNISIFRNALPMNRLHEFGWRLDGDRQSPICHFRRRLAGDIPETHFTEIQKSCLNDGVLLARPVRLGQLSDDDVSTIAQTDCAKKFGSSVRVTLSAAHSEAQVRRAALVVSQALLSLGRRRGHDIN